MIKHHILVWLAPVLALAIICSNQLLYSRLLANLAGIHLVKSSILVANPEMQLQKAQELYLKANAIVPNSRALLGAGIASTWRDDSRTAIENWKLGGVDPTVLVRMGDQALKRQAWNQAMIFYRGGALQHKIALNSGILGAAKICQLTWFASDLLTPSNSDYCAAYFDRNEGNLLTNSQFEAELNGWSLLINKDYGDIYVNTDVGRPAPALVIYGTASDKNLGIYQRVRLTPGTEVRYSGWLKIKNVENNALKPLYIEWKQQERAQGNYLQVSLNATDWTYVERTFQVPTDSAVMVNFYPVVLSGAGLVWIDDVRVELLSTTH